jgi:PDZ domain-containing protein
MQRKTRRRIGFSLAALSALGVVWGLSQPMPYVIVGPGPAFNVISEIDGNVMLKVSGIPETDNPGTLDMLTVSVWGTPDSEPSLVDLLGAYISPDKIVEPMDEYYPFDQNLDEVIKADRKDFTDSISAAIAVAKEHLSPELASKIKVEVSQDDVGGPSAGMMLTLGILEKASTSSLTGGKYIAGTGTIDGSGNVGPIGGIQFKLISAKRAGDNFFLAPRENCSEVIGHVPAGLSVFSVATIDEALNILKVIASDGDTGKLPVCTAE